MERKIRKRRGRNSTRTRGNTRGGARATETGRGLLGRWRRNSTRRCSQTMPIRSGSTTAVITSPRPSASQLSASRETRVPAWKKKNGTKNVANRRSAWMLSFDASRGMRRSEEHTSELQPLMRNSYADFCMKKKKHAQSKQQNNQTN